MCTRVAPLQKNADLTAKVLDVAAKFVTVDAQNAYAIIQGGLKGTAKWCGAEAVLPYLLNTEPDKDAVLTPSQVLHQGQYFECKIMLLAFHMDSVSHCAPPLIPMLMQQNAWVIFAAITQITAALQPEDAKRADLQAQYLSGGTPLAQLLQFIGADTEDYSPSGPCSRSLACLAFLIVSENPEFVSTVIADIVAMDGAAALVKAAKAGGLEIRQQALAILLQLKATDGGDKHLVVAGACDVFAEALDFGCKQLLDKKSPPLSELMWISDTVTTLADLMSDAALDNTFSVTPRVPDTPPEDPAASVEVVDSLMPSVDALIQLLEVQHAQDSQPLVDVLCKSLSKLCRREVYQKKLTALVPRQPPPAQEGGADQEGEVDAGGEAKEGKEGDIDNPDAVATDGDGETVEAEEEIAPIEVKIDYERTQAIKERIFQLGSLKLMQCLNKCEASTREQVEFVLHCVLAGPTGEILTAPREVCVVVNKMMVVKPLSAKDPETDQARYTREVHIALMAARLIARLVDSAENYEVLRSVLVVCVSGLME